MAATISDLIIPVSAPDALFAGANANRRRRISPQAGRALEILGHAIEYLADEYVHRGKTFSAEDPEVKAVRMLMALNRQIYYECPASPTLSKRFRTFFHALASKACFINGSAGIVDYRSGAKARSLTALFGTTEVVP